MLVLREHAVAGDSFATLPCGCNWPKSLYDPFQRAAELLAVIVT